MPQGCAAAAAIARCAPHAPLAVLLLPTSRRKMLAKLKKAYAADRTSSEGLRCAEDAAMMTLGCATGTVPTRCAIATLISCHLECIWWQISCGKGSDTKTPVIVIGA